MKKIKGRKTTVTGVRFSKEEKIIVDKKMKKAGFTSRAAFLNWLALNVRVKTKVTIFVDDQYVKDYQIEVKNKNAELVKIPSSAEAEKLLEEKLNQEDT